MSYEFRILPLNIKLLRCFILFGSLENFLNLLAFLYDVHHRLIDQLLNN